MLADWSRIIERTSKVEANDSAGARIIFRGVVDDEGEFSLDVDATDSDAVLGLLKAIQKSLDLMPMAPKLFYTTIMEALASEAEEKGRLEAPWHLSVQR